MNEKRFLILFLLVLVAVSIAARLLPHLPNFAPIAAFALFAGVYGSRASKGFLLLPLLALALSDLVIGTYHFWVMASVYLSFLAIGAIGLAVARHKNALSIVAGSVGGSVLFYLTTNLAVWAASPLYPATLEGLLASYTLALPFFRNTLLGDLFYTGLFFGTYELALAYKDVWTKSLLYSLTSRTGK